MVWQATIITLFPEAFPGPLSLSVIGRGLRQGIWGLETVNLRDFANNRHRKIDDTPTGGGPGMILRADILARAIDSLPQDGRKRWLLGPRGKQFDQEKAAQLAQQSGVVLLCGRYEGVDERIFSARNVEEISLGDFVLSGGEIAAMAMIETTIRLLDGILGDEDSRITESFTEGLLEYPQYTRPRIWEDQAAPAILSSGDHGKIAAWRRKMSEELTKNRRPDLWRAYHESENPVIFTTDS